ncbi:hypothetical protein L209DRAFT_465989 [Thermothelomyces heterothallicus CBS 203.75]
MQSDDGSRRGSANPNPIAQGRGEDLSEESTAASSHRRAAAAPRLAVPPRPGPSLSDPPPTRPAESSLLLPEQRQYIVDWLHQTALPEDW